MGAGYPAHRVTGRRSLLATPATSRATSRATARNSAARRGAIGKVLLRR
eukprot:CAMPEP_0174850220 /NCGR_PEP_ID=MMETSP1114-20130205/19107_1 /TAXON_ID=312471 /ORGANISM="Neobodo designis, Strain CCAP 1951/1" /LENGTH=48 /DNA_ID= /DNA_START= /DNA_END= /DNA_ORIENTATION=